MTKMKDFVSSDIMSEFKEKRKRIFKEVFYPPGNDADKACLIKQILEPYVVKTDEKQIMIYNGSYWAEDRYDWLTWITRKILTKLSEEDWDDDSDEDCDEAEEVDASRLYSADSVAPTVRTLVNMLPFMEKDGFDHNPRLLHVRNGTVNLESGKLHSHKSADFQSKGIPVKYKENAQSEVFDDFIADITCGDEELARYLQKVFGYAITGETREQMFFILYGSGANGKGTLTDAISAVVGEGYSQKLPAQVFVRSVKRQGAATPEIACLEGIRIVFCSEWQESDRLDEAAIKMLTGSDTIPVRRLYQEPTSFSPSFTLFLDTNYLPQICGIDSGIWHRVQVIPFNASFLKKKRCDVNMLDRLKEEPEAILVWLVKGAQMYYKEGLRDEIPDSVKEATKDYRTRMDSVGSFLSVCTKSDPESKIGSSDLYNAYCTYCEHCSMHYETQTAFSTRLKNTGYTTKRDRKGVSFIGIKLKKI